MVGWSLFIPDVGSKITHYGWSLFIPDVGSKITHYGWSQWVIFDPGVFSVCKKCE